VDVHEGEISHAAIAVNEDEGTDSNGSFSTNDAGGDAAETGGLDSAGEEEEETEGEVMHLS
jgi:hypothetical protein